MERPERPSRHKSSSRMRNQNRRYHLFSDTDSDMEVETDTLYGIRCFSTVVCSGLLGSSNMSVGEPSTSNTVSSLMPETDILVEPDRAPPSQPLSLHQVDNSRELLNVSRRRGLPSQSGQFALRNHDTLMPSHNAASSVSAVDSSTERSVAYRSSGIVGQNNNMCYLPSGVGLIKRYRLISGQGISSDIIDGPSTSRLSDVPEGPNSSISEPEIGMLQVVTDNEGDPPVEPSNQYNSSPPYRELQNQEESEFLRRLDEITFENSVSPGRVRLPARRRMVRVSVPYEPLDRDARSGQESSLPVPMIQTISTLREGAYTPLNGHYSLNIEGDESSRDTENNVHSVEAPDAPESGRQSGDIIILSTPEQQSPPSHVSLLPASPQPPPRSPADRSPLLPSSEQYPSSQSPSHRSSQPIVTSGERCPPTLSPTRQIMTSCEQYTSVTQSQRTVPVTSVQQCLSVNSGSNSYSTSSSGTPEQKDDSKDGSVNNFKELNHNLVSILECPVCLDFMVPPIYQCSKGHIVCMTCRPKLILCPTCRARFADRNLAMEKCTF